MAITPVGSWVRIPDGVGSNNPTAAVAPLNIGSPTGLNRALMLLFAGETNGGLFGDMTYCRITANEDNTNVLATTTPIVAWRGFADDRMCAAAVFTDLDISAIANTDVYVHIDGSEEATLSLNWRLFEGVDQAQLVSSSAVTPQSNPNATSASVTVTGLDAGSYLAAIGLHSQTSTGGWGWTAGVTDVYGGDYPEYDSALVIVGDAVGQSGDVVVTWTAGNSSTAPALAAVGLKEAPLGAVVSDTTTDNSERDVSVDAAKTTVAGADGGIAYAAVFADGTTDPGEGNVRGAVGSVQVAIPGGAGPHTVTFPQITTDNTGAALTASTNYELWVEAYESDGTTASVNRDTFAFATLAPQLVVVIPLVDVSTGADWPDNRTILYDLWHASRWHDVTTPQSADEVGQSDTAGGGILTISTLALTAGDPTFTVMYEEEGTTPGFSPDDFFGVSRQNSVENGLVDANGHARFIESPLNSSNWVATREHITSKEVMAQTLVVMEAPPTGSTFELSFEFDIPPDMLALNLWRALGKGPPANATSVTLLDIRTLEVSFDKEYNSGDTAVLQFQGVKGSSGFAIPRSTWPRTQP